MTAFNTQVIRDLQRAVADLANVTANISAIGVVSGAKVVTDANGTLQQYLRGLVVTLVATNTALALLHTDLGTLGTKLDTIATNTA